MCSLWAPCQSASRFLRRFLAFFSISLHFQVLPIAIIFLLHQGSLSQASYRYTFLFLPSPFPSLTSHDTHISHYAPRPRSPIRLCRRSRCGGRPPAGNLLFLLCAVRGCARPSPSRAGVGMIFSRCEFPKNFRHSPRHVSLGFGVRLSSASTKALAAAVVHRSTRCVQTSKGHLGWRNALRANEQSPAAPLLALLALASGFLLTLRSHASQPAVGPGYCRASPFGGGSLAGCVARWASTSLRMLTCV
jgi:hypothetical protein